MDEETARRLVEFLSQERLEALVKRTGDTSRAIELHQEILALGCELMKVIAIVEIALRNTVVANLTRHFGAGNWLQRSPGNFSWRKDEQRSIRRAVNNARRAAYAKLSQAEKAKLDMAAFPDRPREGTPHLERVKARQARIAVSDGQVVAELSLGFWKGLFGRKYEHGLWGPTLKRTCPNRTVTRSAVASQLEAIYQARNRLAHHEPVLHKRFRETVGAIKFVARELDARREEDVAPLTLLLRDDLEHVTRSGNELSRQLPSGSRPKEEGGRPVGG